MNDQAVLHALCAAAEEVLETMFFTVATEEITNTCNGDSPVRIRVGFDGTPSGVFSVELPATAAQTIAADFLGGAPEEFSQAQVEQVACELANMICGATLSRLGGEAQFDLSSPELIKADDSSPHPGVCRQVWLPDGPLTLCVDFRFPSVEESETVPI